MLKMQNINQAIWVATALFNRGAVRGSAANMSFKQDNLVYITRSGAVFGNLTIEDFVVIDLEGKLIDETSKANPSKEYPLHLAFYNNKNHVNAVIHTHSFYSTAWSCLSGVDSSDLIPKYTPYLEMQLGKVELIPYYSPGSEQLFNAFNKGISKTDGYVLANHGPIVGGSGIIDAFNKIEELEESAKIAWHLKDKQANTI